MADGTSPGHRDCARHGSVAQAVHIDAVTLLATVTLTCIGDSATAGFGATAWPFTYPFMLQEALNNRYPSNGLTTHGRGLLPAAIQTVFSPDYVTYAGAPGAVPGFGFNLNTWDIFSSAAAPDARPESASAFMASSSPNQTAGHRQLHSPGKLTAAAQPP